MYMTTEDREATLVYGRRLDQAKNGLTDALMLAILAPSEDDGSSVVAACREMAEAASSLGDQVQRVVDKSKTDPAYIRAYSRPISAELPKGALNDLMSRLFSHDHVESDPVDDDNGTIVLLDRASESIDDQPS
jgi:hypothetical protein